MSIAMENVRGVLRFFQQKTGIKGYTTQQKQDAKRPYFYFETPRSTSKLVASNMNQYNTSIHGVFFAENDEQMREVLPIIEQWIITERYRIQCVDNTYTPLDGIWLEDINLQYQKADKDIVTFTIRGERFVSVPREEALIQKISNEYDLKG